MIRKVISVAQMSTVLGVSLTAIREGIARDRFPFAYAWQSPGKKSRSFVIDKEGFRTIYGLYVNWHVFGRRFYGSLRTRPNWMGTVHIAIVNRTGYISIRI